MILEQPIPLPSLLLLLRGCWAGPSRGAPPTIEQITQRAVWPTRWCYGRKKSWASGLSLSQTARQRLKVFKPPQIPSSNLSVFRS